jgi:putative transposase
MLRIFLYINHHRRSIRLPDYDYACPGAYFITLVAYQRTCLFGRVRDKEVEYSETGRILNEQWQRNPNHFPNVELGAFIVMPNHVHGIIILHDVPCRGGVTPPENIVKGDETSPLQRPTLGQVVAYFKYQTTKQVNLILDSAGVPLWQRNYYEHIIRSEEEHRLIYDYIESNPVHWDVDEENPSVTNRS